MTSSKKPKKKNTEPTLTPAKNPKEILKTPTSLRAVERDSKGRIKNNVDLNRHHKGIINRAKYDKKKETKKAIGNAAELVSTEYSKVKQVVKSSKDIKKAIDPEDKNDRQDALKEITKDSAKGAITTVFPIIGKVEKATNVGKHGKKAIEERKRIQDVRQQQQGLRLSRVFCRECGCTIENINYKEYRLCERHYTKTNMKKYYGVEINNFTKRKKSQRMRKPRRVPHTRG